MDIFNSPYRALPYRWKYLLFAGRFASAIDRPSGLGFPTLYQFTGDHPLVIRLIKDNGRLAVHLNIEELFKVRRYFNAFWKRIPVMVDFFTRTGPQVRNALADIRDDSADFREPVMSFSSRQPDACLVPDVDFVRSGGFAKYRRLAAAHPHDWAKRSDILVWRGSPAGSGHWSDAMDENDPDLRPRLRMCIKLRDVPNVDAKIYRVQYEGRNAVAVLKKHRLFGEFVPQGDWIGHKFAIDIDGMSNSWTNLFVRLILGCCVIKVASQRGYRQWYYDELVAWQHYVPVQSDLSDLLEKIDWCRSHDAQCHAIAVAGQQFALKRTVESETALTVRRLNEKLGGRG